MHPSHSPAHAATDAAGRGHAVDAVTAVASGDVVTDVLAGRAALDALDEGIRELLRNRVVVSKQVQALRRGTGEPGIQHARENQVIGRYVDALGDPGADIALAILQLCRGRLG